MLPRIKEWNTGADALGRLAGKPAGVETVNEVGSKLRRTRERVPDWEFQEGSTSVKTLEALTAQGGQWGWSCWSLGRWEETVREGRGWRLAGQVETSADSEWDGRTMEGPSRAGASLTRCAGVGFPDEVAQWTCLPVRGPCAVLQSSLIHRQRSFPHVRAVHFSNLKQTPARRLCVEKRRRLAREGGHEGRHRAQKPWPGRPQRGKSC